VPTMQSWRSLGGIEGMVLKFKGVSHRLWSLVFHEFLSILILIFILNKIKCRESTISYSPLMGSRKVSFFKNKMCPLCVD